MGKETKKYIYPATGVEHFGIIIDSKGGFDVISCQNCGFRHIVPIPTKDELNRIYEEEYYSIEKPSYIQELEEDLEWWNITYTNYYKIFEKYCKKGDRKILEIGAGPGFFLKCGKDLGWDVYGFEPSKLACKYSEKIGINLINEFFNEDKVAKYGKFDIVYMNTVIEHLIDPISLLEAVKRLLKLDGVICIIAPNDYSPMQNILRENLNFEPWWVVPPYHINYFDFQSIKKLLERLGFEIVESMGTFPMEFFLLSGVNYIGNSELGRKCHIKRKTFEISMYKHGSDYLNGIYKSLSSIGIGREFVIVAKKIRD